MKDIYYDLFRYSGHTSKLWLIWKFVTDKVFRKIYYHRTINEMKRGGGACLVIIRLLRNINASRITIDMLLNVKVGKGLLFIHPYSIAINSKAVIGDNVTILHGVTIGIVKSGPRSGVPKIGDNVYLGANSTVVGGINIGKNVLIAANSFVDFDVPDNSVVFGNPGCLHHKEKASEIYINNSINNIHDKYNVTRLG